MLRRQVARIAATDLEPLGARAGEAEPDAGVDLEIVGEHQRAGAVHDIGEADGVLEHARGRALEAEVVGAHQGLVDRDRMHHAQLLELAHEREVRIDIGVPAAHFEDLLGRFLALLRLHRSDVVAEHRIVHRRDELGVVVIVAEEAVAVRIGPDADILLPEAVGRAVLSHLPDRDLAGAVGMDVVSLRARGVDRGLVHEQRMRGVAQVLEVEFPVAFVRVLEHAASELELAVRGAVDHVVERRGHETEIVLEARSLRREAAEHEAAVARDARHREHREFRARRVEMRGIAVQQRRGLEAAVEMVGPAVIATAELVGVPAVGGDHHGAAVGALIVQQTDRSVRIAHQQQRLVADTGGEKVPGVSDLALMPDIDPGRAEDLRELALEYIGIGVEAPVHATRLNKGVDIVFGAGCEGHRRLPFAQGARTNPSVQNAWQQNDTH